MSMHFCTAQLMLEAAAPGDFFVAEFYVPGSVVVGATVNRLTSWYDMNTGTTGMQAPSSLPVVVSYVPTTDR